jgi:hypothetical protein
MRRGRSTLNRRRPLIREPGTESPAALTRAYPSSSAGVPTVNADPSLAYAAGFFNVGSMEWQPLLNSALAGSFRGFAAVGAALDQRARDRGSRLPTAVQPRGDPTPRDPAVLHGPGEKQRKHQCGTAHAPHPSDDAHRHGARSTTTHSSRHERESAQSHYLLLEKQYAAGRVGAPAASGCGGTSTRASCGWVGRSSLARRERHGGRAADQRRARSGRAGARRGRLPTDVVGAQQGRAVPRSAVPRG